eukprot:2113772-Pleurochrysis_carterae.AAC.2
MQVSQDPLLMQTCINKLLLGFPNLLKTLCALRLSDRVSSLEPRTAVGHCTGDTHKKAGWVSARDPTAAAQRS